MALTLAPIVDYPTLLAAIKGWVDRTDFDQVAPVLVGLAHAKLNRVLRVRDMLTRSLATIDAGAQFVDLPDDFIEMKRVRPVSSPAARPLEVMTPEQIALRQAENTTSALPTHFALLSTEIEIAPSPTGDFDMEVLYYGATPPLSDTAPTNWIVVKWPEAYLFGALVESAPYLRDDDRMALWQSRFNSIIDEIQAADDRAQLAGARMTNRRGPLV